MTALDEIMGFAPVKSDPWKKRKRARTRKFQLWPAEFWKRLIEQAERDCCREISDRCVEMIRQTNELLYSKEF